MKKPKILIVNEASFLKTGYAIIGLNLLERFYRDGYDVAELAIYDQDHNNKIPSIPWKFFTNKPENKEEEAAWGNHHSNVFGKFKFEKTVCEFKPDFVLDFRDPYMYDFEGYSPLKDRFYWLTMTTVDGLPQHKQWIETNKIADVLFTYTDWGKNQLKNLYGLNAITASPAASDKFFPFSEDQKKALKEKYDLTDYKIVGSVMRNQPRKLIDFILNGFRDYIYKNNDNNTLLYLHTTYPDVGYDLIDVIAEFGLLSKVLVTYTCLDCKLTEPGFFSDSILYCPKCGKYTMKMSDLNHSIPEEELNKVYNLFDVYLQVACREGFGMPQVEASACNIPIITTPYGGMVDMIEKLDASQIDIDTYRYCINMKMFEAVPNHESISREIHKALNAEKKDVRSLFEEHYNSWEKTYQIFKTEVDKLDVSKLRKEKYEILNPEAYQNFNTNNVNYSKWLITNVLREPKYLGTNLQHRLIRDLTRCFTKDSLNDYMIELTNSPRVQHFDRKVAYDCMVKIWEYNSYWKEIYNAKK